MVARGAVIYSRKARGISRRVVCDWQDAVTGRVLGESYGSYVHCFGGVDSNCAVRFDGFGRCDFFRNRYVFVDTSGFGGVHCFHCNCCLLRRPLGSCRLDVAVEGNCIKNRKALGWNDLSRKLSW